MIQMFCVEGDIESHKGNVMQLFFFEFSINLECHTVMNYDLLVSSFLALCMHNPCICAFVLLCQHEIDAKFRA